MEKYPRTRSEWVHSHRPLKGFGFYFGLFTNSGSLCKVEKKKYTYGKATQMCTQLATLTSITVKGTWGRPYQYTGVYPTAGMWVKFQLF